MNALPRFEIDKYESGGPAENSRCLECGYALRGLSTPRYPECGRGFDPKAAPHEFLAILWRRFRWSIGPPKRLFFLGTVLVLGWATAFQSHPRCWSASTWPLVDERIVLQSRLIGAVIVSVLLIYLFKLCCCATLGVVRPLSLGDGFPQPGWGWVAPIFVLLMAGSTLAWDWPLRLRFECSRHSFEAAAAGMKSPLDTGTRWIGLFEIDRISRYSGQIRFRLGAGTASDENYASFVFSPNAAYAGDVALGSGWWADSGDWDWLGR